ncbi:unnamed protein product [Brachionus calyciflorus]|uniref:thioredoxin-dependent peroxiredoxin n=1 Tax=Brachionus calyciflorus TaxID=104777 RepID=A0A813RWR1_9BILA|nr:unnamed protein product [Brachionus calyciflorus]
MSSCKLNITFINRVNSNDHQRKMKKISILILISVICVINADQDHPTCSHPVDKSAVTKEATDEAAKVIENPPVYTSEIYSSKVKILKPAPYFSATAVVKSEFVQLKLTDFVGKYLILLFYPMDFTFVCPTEIIAFSDRISEFRESNTEVVAISTDSQFTHLAWTQLERKKGGLGSVNIPLLSDLTHQISKDYGIVRQITMNDLPVGRSVDETLRLVQAFQYADIHGEVCPANWKKGDRTIIPNPTEKLKYFSKVQD